MMFNDYIWTTYLGGTGKEVVNFFEENLSNKFSKKYADKICEFNRAYCPSKLVNDSLHSELVDAYEGIAEGIWFLEEGEYSIKSAIEYIFNDFLSEQDATPQKVFNYFSGSVAFFTTLFSRELPELFVPYYFTFNFNILEKIAQEFEIILPEIPIKKDYEGRFLYYGKICEALYDFREKYNMSLTNCVLSFMTLHLNM